MSVSNPCVLSPTVFLVNAAVCWSYDYQLYSALFVALFATSVAFHSFPDIPILGIIDKVAVFGVVAYGAITVYQKWDGTKWDGTKWDGTKWDGTKWDGTKWDDWTQIFILLTFVSTLILFFVGKRCDMFCYDPEYAIAQGWHSVLHLIASLGHILVVIL